ncbi:phage protease [Desulfovibrio sp.]|uniref:phage protease n=1 Tax=Desulfovibrio sp. TaxID=885 RepID=UPI003AB4CEC6
MERHHSPLLASAVATQEATDEDSNVLRGKTASEAAVAIRKPADAGNGYRATGLAIALSLSDDTGQDKAAGRIQLFPAGTFAARDGRPGNLRGVNATSWRLTAQDAEAVIAHWQRTATPLVVDYEHQTQLAAQNGRPAPAAGWITSLEWEEGRGLFAGVDWTDKARAHIRAGEYRYISPVFAFDRQSGAVLRLICAALTNHPALDGMDAASATFTPYEEPPMKQILAALGLPETADEAAALAALTTLRQERDSAKAQAEAAPDPQKFVAMATFSAVQKEAAQLRDELTKLKNEAQAAALKDDIEAALKDGRLTAATKGWAESLAKTAPDALKAYLAAQPPVRALAGTQTGGTPPAGDKPGTVSLTAEEQHICGRLGLTREEFIEARQTTEEN